jgi:hypothetical protein
MNNLDVVVETVNVCLLPTGASPTVSAPTSEIAEEEVVAVVVHEDEEVAKNEEEKVDLVAEKLGGGFPASSTSSLESVSVVSSPSNGGSGVLLDTSGLLEEDERLVLELELAAKKLISMRVD